MRLRRALPLLVVLGSGVCTAQAAVPLPAPGMLKADGAITGLTRAGSRIVLTGTFRHIGPYVGGAVALDPGTGARDTSFAQLNGQVSDAISDTAGGWYVAGQFLVGGRRRAVAHILASGAVDPDFDAKVQSFATSLVFQNDRLYVGRYFWPSDKDQAVVALDKRTGARIAEFKPPAYPSNTGLGSGVTELLNARYLYIGRTETGVQAVDARTGDPVHDFNCQCNGHVTALAEAGNVLYVGTSDSGGITAVDERTGKLIPGFSPKPGGVTGAELEDHGPLVFLVDGDRLIVGGRGLRLGSPSTTLAAIDLKTGAADPSFGRGFVNPIHDIVADGDSLLVAGAPRPGHTAPIIRVDRATGTYQDALTPELDGQIDALAGGGKELFVGGRFGSARTTTTDGVAEVDARTGRLVPGFRVRGLGRDPASPLVAGNSLILPPDLQGGRRLTAFSRLTGVRKRAFAAAPVSRDYRTAYAATRKRVYLSFVSDRSNSEWPQTSVRVLSSHSGRRIAQYELPYPGYVETLLPHRGQLFAAGSFRRFFPDGRPRHLATMAVDPLTGAIDDGFDAHTNGPVNSLLGFRDRLYLSGYYDIAYGQSTPQGVSSAFDNTGAVVARFNNTNQPFAVADGLLTGYDDQLGSVARINPYTGRIVSRLPNARGAGFVEGRVVTPTGVFVTASLNLPWSSGSYLYDNFALLLPQSG